MNGKNKIQEIQGLLASIGFHLKEAADGKFEIQNRCGKKVACGDLVTMYYSAVFMANDAKQDPKKYEQMNESANPNELYQAGLSMSKNLQAKK